MYTKLKQIAEKYDYNFEYARRDFSNLTKITNDKVYLFLDPIQIQANFNEMGVVDETIFTGSFLLLVSSEFDDDYHSKYLENIRPLLNTEIQKIQHEFSCSDFTITNWSTTEIINLFDENYDGILVNYSVKK